MNDNKPERSPLTLLAFSTTCFEGIEDVSIADIPPGKYFIVLGGDNGAGKSSLIKSIAMALLGKPADKVPIRQGHDEATATLVFDRLKVVARCFKIKGGKKAGELDYEVKCQVNTEDGWATLARPPREMLDELISHVTWDIGEFLDKKDAEQVRAVQDALKVDVSDLDAKEDKLVGERKIANANVDRITKRNVGLVKVKDAPEVEEDASAIIKEIGEIATHNAQKTALQGNADILQERVSAGSRALETQRTGITTQETAIAEIKAQLLKAEEALVGLNAELTRCEGLQSTAVKNHADAQKLVDEFESKDDADLKARLETIDTTNAAVRENKRIDEALAEYATAEAERATLEQKVQDVRKERNKRLQDGANQSGFDFPGFAIVDNAKPESEKRDFSIWINGLPLRQNNTETKIRFATMFGAMEKPVLRIFALGDGEKITPKNMAIIEKIATETKTYIFTEMAVTAKEVVDGFRSVDYFLHEGRLVDPASVVEEAKDVDA